MIAVPEGSKPAEAVLGDCYSAQGAISSVLSVGNGSDSASKLPLILCQKGPACPRAKRCVENHSRYGTSKGAKLLHSVGTHGVVLTAALLVRPALL